MKKCTGGSLILILTLFSLRYCLYPFHSTSPLPTKKTLIHRSSLPTIKLQGLNDLFSTPNFTHPNPNLNPNPKLIWAHMLPLLSRPDSLPAIADGVREASIAWKDLLVDIKAEKDSKFEVDDGKKKCPFSVGGNGSVLEIPCGLVEDSAVTIVGVPIGKNGSSWFGFELVGNGNGDGELLPVVVRVNVSVGGDEVVVSQSSWRVDSGWGEWEFCPGRRGAANTSNFKGNFW